MQGGLCLASEVRSRPGWRVCGSLCQHLAARVHQQALTKATTCQLSARRPVGHRGGQPEDWEWCFGSVPKQARYNAGSGSRHPRAARGSSARWRVIKGGGRVQPGKALLKNCEAQDYGKGSKMEPEALSMLNVLKNLEPETEPSIKELAERDKAILIAFIAPHPSVRISPVEYVSASISLFEEFGIEEILDKVNREVRGTKKLYLLVNSPGGTLASSYKVAKAIAETFDEITVFVPYRAMSGGTLISLTGATIVMGMMSSLGPLDVQVPYKGTLVSTNSFLGAFQRLTNVYRTTSRDEAPYPLQAMVEQFDPIIMEEISRSIGAGQSYAENILTLAGYPEAMIPGITSILLFHEMIHGLVISLDDAKKIGLRARSCGEYPDTWTIMKTWLNKYLMEGAPTHHIRYYIPESLKQGKKPTKPAGAKKTTAKKTTKAPKERKIQS